MARRISPRCWATGCALALAALASPAFADQFKQAADGSAVYVDAKARAQSKQWTAVALLCLAVIISLAISLLMARRIVTPRCWWRVLTKSV